MPSVRSVKTLAALLPTLPVLAGAALLCATGCSESSTPLSGDDPGTVEQVDSVPEISELETAADLTAEQSASLARALEDWRRAAAAEESSSDILLEDAPAVAFLSRAATVVRPDQMDAVLQVAQRAVDLRNDTTRPDPGDRQADRHRGLRGLFRNLELEPDQIAAIRDAQASHRDAAQDLCQEFRDGNLTKDELRQARIELRNDFMSAVDAVLTDKQRELFEGNKVEIVIRRLSRLLENFETRVEKRVAHYDALLELDDDQEAAITDILLQTKPDLEALLADVEAGSVTAAEAYDSFRDIRSATRDAVWAELTEEQIEVLEKLRDMHQPCGGVIEE